MLVVPFLSLNHIITGWLPVHTSVYTIKRTHTQQRVVCQWNLSETKVLARLSCAACSGRFMREITSFTPSSTVAAQRKNTRTLFLLGHMPQSELVFHLFFQECLSFLFVVWVETNGQGWLANAKVETGYTGIVFTELGETSSVSICESVLVHYVISYGVKGGNYISSNCGKTLSNIQVLLL